MRCFLFIIITGRYSAALVVTSLFIDCDKQTRSSFVLCGTFLNEFLRFFFELHNLITFPFRRSLSAAFSAENHTPQGQNFSCKDLILSLQLRK